MCARVEKKGENLGSHIWLQPRQWLPVITLALRKIWPFIPAVARTGNGFRRKSFGAGGGLLGESFLALAKQPFPTLEKAGISCDNACCVYFTLSAVSTALMTPRGGQFIGFNWLIDVVCVGVFVGHLAAADAGCRRMASEQAHPLLISLLQESVLKYVCTTALSLLVDAAAALNIFRFGSQRV